MRSSDDEDDNNRRASDRDRPVGDGNVDMGKKRKNNKKVHIRRRVVEERMERPSKRKNNI